jgi:pilus assembly protein CpaB
VKRSSRLFMLLGVGLAVVAFVLVMFMGGSKSNTPSGNTGNTNQDSQVNVVVVKNDIPLGDQIAVEDLGTTKMSVTDPLAVSAYRDPAQVQGLIARRDLRAGQVLSPADFGTAGTATNVDIVTSLDKGLRAMSVQVDQVTGVGTLIQPGDRVDVLSALSESDAKFPLVWCKTVDPESIIPCDSNEDRVAGPVSQETYNGTTTKVVVQNVQVLGTLLPPPPEDQGQEQPAEGEASNEQGTALTGQQQIVIVAVTPQQAEIIRFTQLDGNLSLVLRSPEDKDTAPDATTGVTLANLVTQYGVLKPEMLEALFPPK